MRPYGIVFNWVFDVACNYRCPYCYFDGHWSELAASQNRRPLEIVVEAWRKVYERHGECLIQFAGGEPTVYPQFDELLIALTRWHRWVINTNLSWKAERWEALARKLDPGRGDVFVSYHPTENPDLREFIERAVVVKKLGFWSSATIVAYPPILPRLRFYLEEMLKRGLDVRTQPFVGQFQGREYPQAYAPDEHALIGELTDSGKSTLTKELPYAIGDESPLGKPCHAGQLYCIVDREGNVYRCLQLKETPEHYLGNIYSGFELRKAPSPCPARLCTCGESMWLTENLKRHIGDVADDSATKRVAWEIAEPPL